MEPTRTNRTGTGTTEAEQPQTKREVPWTGDTRWVEAPASGAPGHQTRSDARDTIVSNEAGPLLVDTPAQDVDMVESRRSATWFSRGPWKPSQFFCWALSVLFLVLGGICLARTGIDLSNVSAAHVDVAGSIQTQLMGYIEIGYGLLLALAGTRDFSGRGSASALGLTALVFGIIVAAQPSSFASPLGIGTGYGAFLIIVGAALIVVDVVSPTYSKAISITKRGK